MTHCVESRGEIQPLHGLEFPAGRFLVQQQAILLCNSAAELRVLASRIRQLYVDE